MVIYEFVIEGYIVPYVRMTRRGKYVQPRAIRYLSSQDAIVLQLRNQMNLHGWQKLPAQTPLAAAITIEAEKSVHKVDLDNQIKAILDAAGGVVFPNDMWIDKIIASRCVTGNNCAKLGVQVL